MFDLDARISELANRGASRAEIMRDLDIAAGAAETRARRFDRGPRDQRYRHAEKRALVDRIGKILFFLHHGTPADTATAEDHRLYALLRPLLD